MKIIRTQHRALKKLFPVRLPEAGQALRPFAYLVTAPVPEGLLIYNAVLCDCALLEGEEQALLRCTVFPEEPSETLLSLLELRFLVPVEQDDHAFCEKVKEGAWLIRRLAEEKGYSGFTILTTTACNARCFYCYEKGCKAEAMTPKTASAVIEYILREGNQKHVSLSWFGGEPTLNARVIDQISDALSAAGRAFSSTMISNGYLMDEKHVEKAAGPWKLKSIQITLDGTEEVYNQRKAYVDTQGSAFQKVMGNIGLLLDAGIQVSVRLNVDAENAEDLCVLADQLAERFSGRRNFSVYAHEIFEEDKLPGAAYLERREACRMVSDRLKALGLSCASPLDGFPRIAHCMADSGSSPVILPDGSLNSCEHITQAPAWGSVDQPKERPLEAAEYWQEKYPEQTECLACSAYPTCIRLVHCETYPVCTPEMRSDACAALKDRLKATWNHMKTRTAPVQDVKECQP